MNTILHLTAVLASLWASIFAFETLGEPALGGSLLILFFGFAVMTLAAVDDDLFIITGRKILGFRGDSREGLSVSSKIAAILTVVFLFISTINVTGVQIGQLSLFTPAADAASDTTNSPSGLELIDKKLTLFQGCADKEFEQWTETTDLWDCSNTLTSPTVLEGMTVDHTATEADDHAVEIDHNAAGFGDSKALDFVYTSGAIGLGDDEAVVLINIDQSAATGGEIVGLEVLTTEGGANVFALEAGGLVNPIIQLSGVFTDMASALSNDVDVLAQFISTASNVTIFADDDDTVTIGNATKFEEIEFLLATTASNPGIKPTFEFSTGVGTWQIFTPTDGTNGMRNTGIVAFKDDDIPTWVNGAPGQLLIRITRTQNNLNTDPIESKVQILPAAVFSWDKLGDLRVNAGQFSSTLGVTGAAIFDSTLNVAGLTTLAVAGNPLIQRNITDANSNQVGILSSDDPTPSDNNEIFLSWMLADDNGDQAEFFRITAIASDVTNDSKDGFLIIEGSRNDVFREYLRIGSFTGGANSVVVNDDGLEMSFRVEGASNPNVIVTQGSTDNVGIGGSTVTGTQLALYGDLDFQQGSEISTTANALTLNPTTNTVVSSDPLIIQNVSQNTTPGTTVDGQIRLWEDADAGGGASDGRILYQINGTTYQVNADAGITFSNNPLLLARDKALFQVGFNQWKLDKITELDNEFIVFTALHPTLDLVIMTPEWSVAYLEHLAGQYAIADAGLNSDDEPDHIVIPRAPTRDELAAENPWPDPNTYKIADATSNETKSKRTGTEFDVGDSIVLTVDRKKARKATGEAIAVHTVPSLLTDEFIHLLQTDATFLNRVKSLLGV